MPQFGLFDYQQRLSCIDKAGGLLVELNQVVDWEQFREGSKVLGRHHTILRFRDELGQVAVGFRLRLTSRPVQSIGKQLYFHNKSKQIP